MATSLLNEASIFFKSSSDSKDATTCDIVDEKLLLRSKEFLNGDILSSKVALSEFLKESVKSQDAFEGMYFCGMKKSKSLKSLCCVNDSDSSPPLTDANRQIESAFLEISMRKLGLEKKQEEENTEEE